MFPKGGSTGMEMMLKSLKAFVPPEVWAMVEKNIISMVTKVANIESELMALRAGQIEILEAINGKATTTDGPGNVGEFATGSSEAGERPRHLVALNGKQPGSV